VSRLQFLLQFAGLNRFIAELELFALEIGEGDPLDLGGFFGFGEGGGGG
jgi:hypothetical protein